MINLFARRTTCRSTQLRHAHIDKKKYIMAMFPYPSGKLHMGHARVYTISDVLARTYRMMGYKVLHPMGWDAFGLPAENAAMERNVHPSAWTLSNIEQMKQQLESLHFQFDWDRQVTTCMPDYYAWTQWLFIRLFNRGLAYQQEAIVNWDPVDETVLANEQVDANGRSWRSGALVEKRKLKQWFFKIRSFADALLDDMELLNEWPEQVKKMQEKWIGRSKGAEFTFMVGDGSITVFTTRPETIHGVTFLAISKDNIELLPILDPIKQQELNDYIESKHTHVSHLTNRSAPDTCSGLYLGIDAIHPLNGSKLPIYVADYVVSDFAHGCVMGVPAHDERDNAFAKAHGITIRQVIDDENKMINSHEIDGMNVEQATNVVIEQAERDGIGKASVQYRLRDWLVSRQRYWGAPIPIIHCPQCGPVPVPEDQLPIKLPEQGLSDINKLSGSGGTSPLARYSEWVNVKCPCGKGIDCKRDTDTMDTFVDSSWYFLRYGTNTQNRSQVAFDQEANDWMNVDLYIGGIEHAVLHLLYARFIQKFLHSEGLTTHVEPFQRLLAQGMVQGKTYKDPETDRYLKPDEPRPPNVNIVWEKMSKSKHNGVDPGDVVAKYGPDVVRLFMLFKAPFEKELEWDEQQIVGQERFLNKIDTLANRFIQVTEKQSRGRSTRVYQDLVKQISDGLTKNYSFNTCVSNLHKYVIAMQEDDITSQSFETAMLTLPSLMAPFTPKFAQELFIKVTARLPETHELKKYKSVHETPFPQSMENFSEQETVEQDTIIEMVITVNGKKKGELKQVPKQVITDHSLIEQYVRDKMPKILSQKVERVIVVNDGRIVNFVVKR
jgi:leucyl-tRNA synthetase